MREALFSILILIGFLGFSQETQNTIRGTVTDGKRPLANVNIKIIDTYKGVKTDKFGDYSITASVGEALEYSYIGYATIQIIVEDVTSVLNLNLVPVTEQLDEVVVKKNKRKSQKELGLEYYRNKNIVRTKFGYIEKDKASYTIRTYSGDELPKGGHTLQQALRILYPQLRIDGDSAVYLRPNSSFNNNTGAIFDLDGQTLLTPPLLTIDEIDRVAIIPSASYSVRYGTVAAGGVIVINTKRGKIKPKTDAIEVKDLQAAHAEFINYNFCEPQSEIPQANQLKELFAAKSETDAIEIFNEEKAFFEKSPYVLIDAGNYFNTHWKNKEIADKIWDGVKVKFSDDPNVLKVIAYYFEEQGSLQDALSIYQKISALRPKYGQTYRDLANMHNRLDNPKQALNLYTKYLKAQKEGSSEGASEGINFVVNVEALDILSKEKMKKSKAFQDLELPFKDASTRILLEWNDGETEFDVQMIRQDKSSVIWKHSYQENPVQITQEKKLGYSTKQFFIDKADTGKWVFNINYLGNKSENPSYLKATVQYDYGTKSQKEIVKVVRLPEQKSCLKLLSI